MLVDSGDLIQGSPLEYVHARINNGPPDPMISAMNVLGYDAMALGNHEYNYGRKVLEKARHEAVFPWLSANTIDMATGMPAYMPYVVKVVQGVRVGILGLTTPGIPSWEDPKNYAGLTFRPTVPEARRWVQTLRTTEHADVVVIAMHMGMEADLRTGEPNPGQVPNENAALAIARDVSGVAPGSSTRRKSRASSSSPPWWPSSPLP